MKRSIRKSLLFLITIIGFHSGMMAQCPINPVVITGQNSVCVGSSSIYTIAVNDPGNHTVSITGGATFNSQLNPGSVIIPWTTVGSWEIKVNFSGCSGASASLTVNVINSSTQPAPTSIIGPAYGCISSSTIYSVPPISGMTTLWKISKLPFQSGTLPTLAMGSNQVTVNWNSAAATYLLTAAYSNGSCTGNEVALVVSSKNGITPVTITGNGTDKFCQGESFTFTANSSIEDSYNWTLSGGGNLTQNGKTATVQWINQGSFTLTVTANNPCSPTPRTATKTINVGSSVSVTPGPITKQYSVSCPNQTERFSIAPVSGATNYEWKFVYSTGTNYSHITTTPYFDHSIPTLSNITLTVKASNGFCFTPWSAPLSFNVGYKPLSIIYPPSTCVGTPTTLSVSSESSLIGLSFNWNVQDAIIIGPPNGSSITVQWNSSGLKGASVVSTTSCGNIGGSVGPSTSIKVHDSSLNFQLLSESNQACLGNYKYYWHSNQENINIAWSVTLQDGSPSSINNFYTYTSLYEPNYVSFNWVNSGDYILKGTATNSCGTSVSSTLNISVLNYNRPNNVVINGIPSITCDESYPTQRYYSITPQSQVSYLWETSAPQAVYISSSAHDYAYLTINQPSVSFLYVTPYTAHCVGEKKSVKIWSENASKIGILSASTNMVCYQGTVGLSVSSNTGTLKYSVRKRINQPNQPWSSWETFNSPTYNVLAIGNKEWQYEFISEAQTNGCAPAFSNSVFVLAKPTQNILNFSSLPIKTYGNPAFSLSASSTSGLIVSYTSSNTTVATIVGNTVTIVGAGSATITASQAGNSNVCPADNLSQILQVNKATLTATVASTSRIYAATNPSFTINYSGLVNGETSSVIDILPTITTSATQTSNVGAYPLTLSGGSDNNYTFNYVNGTLAVNKAALIATATNASRTYGSVNPVFTINYTGFLNGETSSVIDTQPSTSTTATVTSNVGTYPITLLGGLDNNYTINFINGTLTVNKATLSVTASSTSRTYGAANPTLTLSYLGFQNGESTSVLDILPTVGTAAVVTSNVGTYPISLSGGSDNNYVFNYTSGTLTINKAPLTATPTNASRTYGAANPTFGVNYIGFVNGENSSVIDIPPVRSTTATVTSNTGTYPITVSGGTDNNYAFTYGAPATLTITKAALTATTTATKVYGAANPAFPITYTGFMNGETASVIDTAPTAASTATTLSNVGTYPITLTGGSDNNYSITNQAGSLSVTKKGLTATAVSTSKYVGQPNPSFSISYSGFVNGENSSVLDEQPVTTTTATTGSPIGSYPINVSGGSDNNYSYTYVNGVLSVLAVPTCSFYISQSGNLCTDGRVLLRANVTNGTPVSYSWSTGGSSNRIYAYWSDYYTVTVTFSNGCTATETYYVEPPTGSNCIYYLKEEPKPEILFTTLYPNPVDEELVLELTDEFLDKYKDNVPVMMVDMMGKTVIVSEFSKGEKQVRLETKSLLEGVYLVQIGSGKTGVVRKKVMIVH